MDEIKNLFEDRCDVLNALRSGHYSQDAINRALDRIINRVNALDDDDLAVYRRMCQDYDATQIVVE